VTRRTGSLESDARSAAGDHQSPVSGAATAQALASQSSGVRDHLEHILDEGPLSGLQPPVALDLVPALSGGFVARSVVRNEEAPRLKVGVIVIKTVWSSTSSRTSSTIRKWETS